MMNCPKCGAPLQNYVNYCAGQPIVVYFCPYCHYDSANVEIIYSDRSCLNEITMWPHK